MYDEKIDHLKVIDEVMTGWSPSIRQVNIETVIQKEEEEIVCVLMLCFLRKFSLHKSFLKSKYGFCLRACTGPDHVEERVCAIAADS